MFITNTIIFIIFAQNIDFQMKKITYITIISCLSIFMLQGIWIDKSYNSYKESFLTNIEYIVSNSISREVMIREGSANFCNENKHSIYYQYADDMTEEERISHQGSDTIDISLINKGAIGHSIEDIIIQLQQDALMNKNPLRLSLLDSVFTSEYHTKIKHCIISLDRDTNIVEKIGYYPMNSYNTVSTQYFPIGTKGLQYVQLIAKVPLNRYLREMMLIFVSSVIIMLLISWILIYQLIIITQQDFSLKLREKIINGTIHDLKSPLGNVVTLLSWMSSEEMDGTKKNIILSSTKKVQLLIDDINSLLSSAKSYKGKITVEYSDCTPSSLSGASIERVSENLLAKPHTLSIKDETNDRTIRCDRSKMENVLKNLIENSLKYSDDDVQVSIIFSSDSKNSIIKVADNGWGIDKKDQKHIFDEFYQAHNKGKSKSGYGIGLSYSKQIIKAHKGKITLSSSISKGTTITCYIPL